MRRLLLGVLGAYLLVLPAQSLYNNLWPVPEARTIFAVAFIALYGGTAIGAGVPAFRHVRGRKVNRRDAAVGAFAGAILAVVAAFALTVILAGGAGNIAPVFVAVGAVHAAILSASVALLWTAIVGSQQA